MFDSPSGYRPLHAQVEELLHRPLDRAAADAPTLRQSFCIVQSRRVLRQVRGQCEQRVGTAIARLVLMATETQKRELHAKLTALIETKFGGDRRLAFDHYDVDGDGCVNTSELKILLSDAGIGNSFTRWAWANGIVEELDRRGDGMISWEEFVTAIE